MQVALDIADGGHEAILVEMEPSIGGHRGQVSETFPALDCSRCILTPRTVEVGQHPSTEMLTLSEVVGVEELSGGRDEDPGVGRGTGLARNHGDGFHMGIKNHPRRVDKGRCTAYGDCAEARPVVVPNEFDRGLAAHRAPSQRESYGPPTGRCQGRLYSLSAQGPETLSEACPAARGLLHVKRQASDSLQAPRASRPDLCLLHKCSGRREGV
jgi:heterodisulfide reductase subunit A-like polyferredoxin